MVLSNDTRGWIMTCISGVACVLGASVICADIFIRMLPGKRNFRIQDSDWFLSASLSLSFGVMLFSSLYSMLPSAKRSLQAGGFSPKAAAWILIACFIAGVVGIQIISRVMHHFMPSHVVDCEHSHEEEEDKADVHNHDHAHGHTHEHGAQEEHTHDEQNQRSLSQGRSPKSKAQKSKQKPSIAARPRLMQQARAMTEQGNLFTHPMYSRNADGEAEDPTNMASSLPRSRRQSFQARFASTIHKLTSSPKPDCDGDGPCYGFSEPCGKECFKFVQSRGSYRGVAARSIQRSESYKSNGSLRPKQASETTPLLNEIDKDPAYKVPDPQQLESGDSSDTAVNADRPETASSEPGSPTDSKQHHHHVPTNAFLSIGLQTSIAIALHKLPEGFITYATNHANPKLGVSVFLALFIHNITEGFAMALPLYLAINSRWQAMFWSSLLGGFSQPLGAGVAALWFRLAGSGDSAPGEGVYGGMFAVTAGIMASVALQLFSESLIMTHNRGLCMVFAFIGMGILGISSALTA